MLIADGLISVVGNPHGGTGSRRYQVNMAALRESLPKGAGDKLSPVEPMSPPLVTPASETDDASVAGTNTIHQFDPPLPARMSSTIDWSYLRQLSEDERVVVIDMLIGVAESQHQNIVDELAGALRAKAIKTQWPAWMHGLVRRVRAGAFVPNHALAIQRDRQRVMREAVEAEQRRVEEERRRDPAVRERGLAAMKAALAEMGIPAKGKKSSR